MTQPLPSDRRREDRRGDDVNLSDYTVPEFRKALLTIGLLLLMLFAFFYMVRHVLVAVVAGIVVGVYLIPVRAWLASRIKNRSVTAILSILLVTVPMIAILTYSWVEISSAAKYLDQHSEEIAARLSAGLKQLPFGQRFDLEQQLPRWVNGVADSSASIADELREAVDILMIGIAVFLFTCFYVLTEHEKIRAYIRSRIPGRYHDLTDPVAENIQAVVYGVLYGTFLTQLIKSVVILTMNLIWNVPLAIVLAIASFFIGLLPVVGSWTIYTPVAVYLMLWRGDLLGGVLMLIIGFVGNTLFMSMYLRPKLAAEKSEVLNFYWMFIALVTGVYTFGLMGIIIGPVLIAVLKSVLDAVAGRKTLIERRRRPREIAAETIT
jgi:predicted PurR-regulated permease PerM